MFSGESEGKDEVEMEEEELKFSLDTPSVLPGGVPEGEEDKKEGEGRTKLESRKQIMNLTRILYRSFVYSLVATCYSFSHLFFSHTIQ